jgi:GT2 family glycosyltransferase
MSSFCRRIIGEKMKNVLIGIITFNGAHRVYNCLQSIKKWDDIPEGYKVDILVVDDGSHEPKKSEMMWVSQHCQIPVLFHAENQGISSAWNDICRFGNSEFIILLNDDILVSKHWLTCMVYFLEKNHDAVGACGWNFYFTVNEDIPQILEADEPLIIRREPITKAQLSDYPSPHNPGRVMAATGSCFAFSRERYEQAGGFDENYKSFYEETCFGTMLASLGYASFMLPYPYLYHLWGQTFAENPTILKPQIRMNQSRMYYKEKWNGDIDYTHPKFMNKIKPVEVTWLDENLEPQKAVIE